MNTLLLFEKIIFILINQRFLSWQIAIINKKRVFYLSNCLSKKIGIIGGGQLGKMMILEAKKMGFYITVLDPAENCPCHSISNEHIVADFDDRNAIKLLASKSDVVTYEFEHIDYLELIRLENEGKKVYPTAESLKIIQNKLTQKKAMAENLIPVADFIDIKSEREIYAAGRTFGYPFILKTCTGGYDGKGNAFVENSKAIPAAFKLLGNGKIPLMAEKLVNFVMEISVLACRAIDGSIVVYPVGDNRHIDNILHETVVPASISNKTADNAMIIAKKVMEVFDGIGMFCVEMFVTENGDVIVNEVAPRPHNSGHYSIEGCVTSQFENHIRAITGLPLGTTKLIHPTVMINLLAEKNAYGEAIVIGAEDALKTDGVKLHIYGKKTVSPRRKMGHITASANTLEEALKNAELAFSKIKITSKEQTKCI